MKQREAETTTRQRRRAVAGALLMGVALGGCEVDSFMDPSVLGRWEHTPTVVPVLDRITAIEQGDPEFVETSEITSDDLIPLPEEYRINPGDQMQIRIRDLFTIGVEEPIERIVDSRGYIDIPKLGSVRVYTLTEQQVKDEIARLLLERDIIRTDPSVTVIVVSQRQQTFSVIGAVPSPGTFYLSAGYRLLEGLTVAGGFDERIKEIYVIRPIQLDERVRTGLTPALRQAPPGGRQPAPDGGGGQEDPNLIDLIDELTEPKPAVIGSAGAGGAAAERRPAQPESQPEPRPSPPPIDLEDPAPRRPESPGASPASAPSEWRYIDGQWVKVGFGRGQAGGGGPPVGLQDTRAVSELVTQRVIRVPTRPLLAGAAGYNVVIRPGDIIRVPSLSSGLIYVGGAIARPGTYDLAQGLTLRRAVTAAGDLSGIAIPERVDLIRMVGTDRQGMIRLNLRAIAEGTQPDVFLKDNDHINIGTNFFAYPLAVLRNGLRTSYGFGFLLDRNFGNDVFGAPPSNLRN